MFMRYIRPAALLAAALLWLGACAPAAPSAPATPAAAAQTPAPTLSPAPAAPAATPSPIPGALFVDAAQQLGPISPLVYGTNYGPWMGAFLPDVQRQVEAAGFTFLRFPGGDWGDQNDLTAQQVDDFIALCRKLGAEPSISVRLRGGTPEAAAALLRYTNIQKKYQVRYWSIGNEPTLYSDYDIARFNKEWRAIAVAMRAVDPSIVLMGPDVHQFDPQGQIRDPKGRFTMQEFDEAFLRANGDLAGVVAIHRYAFPLRPSDGDPSPEQLRDNSAEWDQSIPALRALIREAAGRDLPIAATEVNSNWTATFGGDATPDSHLGAIWWADVLARLIRQRVDIVAQFALYAPESAGWGLLRAFSTRPAYYVYPMFRRFGSELVYASSGSPLVTLVAARRNDGALTLIAVNRGSQPATLPLTLAGFTPTGAAETWRFDREHTAEQLDLTPLGANPRLSLPGESMTLLIVRSQP
jgi:hypothetical protein